MPRWAAENINGWLGKPPDWVPATEEEDKEFLEKAIDLLRVPGKENKYKEVFWAGGARPWQAKVYVRPGKQKALGRFSTPRLAANEVLRFRYLGDLPEPPSPVKECRKRGQGRKPYVKRAPRECVPTACVSPTSVLVVEADVLVTEEPPDDACLVTVCEPIE